MKRKIGALLLFGVIIMFMVELRGSNYSSQTSDIRDFDGEWEFEKAVILERKTLEQRFQVKHEINTAEGLEKLDACLHQAVKRISIGDVVHVTCPFTIYCGRAVFVTFHDPEGDRYLLTVGVDPEELGKETPIPDVFFNVVGLDYWIEKIDHETIAITKEALCIDNSVETHSAVRCILKKNN
jgi:hypothetical protein